MDNKDREIKKLKKRISGLEKALQIVSGHSGRIEKNLKQLFEAVSDTIPVPLVISSSKGKILFSNRKVLEIFGYSEEKIYRSDATLLYDNPEDRAGLVKSLDNGGQVKSLLATMKKSDGSVFPASLFSHKIMFENENCLLTVIYDLSEIKKEEEKRLALERQIRQTQKMEALGTFASGIAHDFNNILCIIFGRLQLAMMMLPDEAAVRQSVNLALTAANRAKDMITQILAFCRQGEQKNRPFNIYLIISESVNMIRSITHPNIKVGFRAQTKTSVIVGDPTQIQQVLMNLCSNANHALREQGGVIEISLEEIVLNAHDLPNLDPGAYVRLTVRDNGPGINKNILERIFEPFFTTKAPGEGTGMGLAIVHGIIRSHGGDLIAESEIGKGSAFYCYIPLGIQPETNEKSDDHKVVRRGTERILFVDDEKDIAEAYSKMLEHLGYRLTIMTTSTQALALFKENPDQFDLVITDYIMPVMSGTLMVSEILKIRPTIPVIMVTGSEAEEEIPTEIGIKAVIRKPFTISEIGSVIREILDKSPITKRNQ